MICAYCGKEAKGTKEHIISSGILGLFSECFATIDGERSIVHQGGHYGEGCLCRL